MFRYLFWVGVSFFSVGVSAQIQFQDVTDIAGPFHTGSSYGASWGDINGDGWPDFYANNHQLRGSLYRNNGDGTFTDIILSADRQRVFLGDTTQDTHGATWADFDNDGDMDLLSARSSELGRYQLFVNSGGVFTEERGVELGLSAGGGRMGVWLDYNGDGKLDISAMSANWNSIYRQDNNGFTDVTSSVGMFQQCFRDNYAQLLDVTGDGIHELICGVTSSYPEKVFDYSSGFFQDVSNLVYQDFLVPDVALGDFNNDLKIDMFRLRGRIRPSEAVRVRSDRVEGYMTVVPSSNGKGFSFGASGPISFEFIDIERQSTANSSNFIFVGSSAIRATSFPLTLDPADSATWGVRSNLSGSLGIYIGYDTSAQQWVVQASAGSNSFGLDFIVAFNGTNMTEPTSIGFTNPELPRLPSLVMATDTGYEPVYGYGIDELWCKSVVAGDFDNDMDMDIYAACGASISNLPNRLFENQGDGTFVEVPDAGGAAGFLGVGMEINEGASESVVMADYNVDGYLDLFVTNGPLLVPIRSGGPDQMFLNTSSGNHWIQLDLEGVTSNRDAIGATVTATAGGVSQIRDQDGGYHRWSQNHMRIHFGLGQNTTVDLTVEWPSGQVDQFNGVQADQLYRVVEGGSIVPTTPGAVTPLPSPQSGDECGAPLYEKSLDQAAFLWKNCSTNRWSYRVAAGGSDEVIDFGGEFVSTSALTSVTLNSIEFDDVVDNTTDPDVISYLLRVDGNGEDGFDFSGGNNTCVYLNTPAGARLLIGSKMLPAPNPVNLVTMTSAGCDVLPRISIDDVSVGEGAGSAQFTLSLSQASSSAVSVDYQTVDGSALGGSDFIAQAPLTVSFPAFSTTQTISVPIIQDATVENTELFTVLLSNPVNAIVEDDTGVATILDDEVSPCGQPSYDKANEQAVFIWKDCTDNSWHARMTAGGNPVIYQGNVFAEQNIAGISGFSLENGDVLDNSTDPKVIAFQLAMAGAGQDGFDFNLATDVGSCFALDAPAGVPVYVSATRLAVSPPFDLGTLSACTTQIPPGISIADVTASEGSGAAVVSVTLAQASTQSVTVNLTSSDGTAVAPGDYQAVSSSVSFTPGQVEQLVNIPVVNDSLAEGPEDFTLTLSNPVNGVLLDATATVTIADDEVSPCGAPVYDKAAEQGVFVWKDCSDASWHVRMTAGGAPVTYQGSVDGAQNFFTVDGFSLEAGDVLDSTTDPTRIDYSLFMANAGQDGFDFTLPTESEVCFSSDLPATVPVFLGAARSPMASRFDLATLAACGSAPVPVLSIADASVNESDGTLDFAVSLSFAASQDVSVDYVSSDVSANAGSDYSAVSGMLNFSAGVTNQTVSVPIINDTLEEGAETFNMTLSNVMGVDIGRATAVGTILDDDAINSTASVSDVSVNEGTASATFTVSLSAASSSTVTIDYATADGTANAGQDYIAAAGTATFAAGETNKSVSVTIVDDQLVEPGESFSLNLSNPVGVTISDASGVASIVDNDALPSLSIAGASVSEEDGSVNLQVSLSAAYPETVTVAYATENGSALAGSDFVAASGTLSFAPGVTSQSIALTLVNDTTPEPEESFGLRLSNPNNATLGTALAAIIVSDTDGPVTLFSDDFEGASAWVNDPNGSDNGTTGQWEAADPDATSFNGVSLQPGDAFAGARAMVTTAAAGSSPPGSFDVDNGVVSIRSPNVAVPAGSTTSVSLAYFFAHLDNASSSDFFRITAQGNQSSRVLLEILGSSTNRTGSWNTFSTDISDFAGQSIVLLLEAADNGGGSLIEAGVDSVVIEQQ